MAVVFIVGLVTLQHELLVEQLAISIDQYITHCLLQALEAVARHCPRTWVTRALLHHDNRPEKRATNMVDFLAQELIKEVGHPPYSPEVMWLYFAQKCQANDVWDLLLIFRACSEVAHWAFEGLSAHHGLAAWFEQRELYIKLMMIESISRKFNTYFVF